MTGPAVPSGPVVTGFGFVLAAEALDAMRAEYGGAWCIAGTQVELAWRLRTDFARKLLHSPELLAVGNTRSVRFSLEGLERGDVIAHNHPTENITPSEEDLALAAGRPGMGTLILGLVSGKALMVVPPRPPMVELRGSWAFGNWMVFWKRPIEKGGRI